jgi:hypothetical protein
VNVEIEKSAENAGIVTKESRIQRRLFIGFFMIKEVLLSNWC